MFLSHGKSTALKHFCKCFILHVTTVYLQAVFDPAKNVLQLFCKCFRVKHLKNILEVVTCETRKCAVV